MYYIYINKCDLQASSKLFFEKLLVLNNAQLRQFGASLRGLGYFVFLSFGSRVLQIFLTLKPSTVHDDKTLLSSKGNDEAEESSMSDEGPPITMEDVLCDLCKEVEDSWISLFSQLFVSYV